MKLVSTNIQIQDLHIWTKMTIFNTEKTISLILSSKNNRRKKWIKHSKNLYLLWIIFLNRLYKRQIKIQNWVWSLWPWRLISAVSSSQHSFFFLKINHHWTEIRLIKAFFRHFFSFLAFQPFRLLPLDGTWRIPIKEYMHKMCIFCDQPAAYEYTVG